MPWLQSENNIRKRKLAKYGFKLKQVDLELSFFGRNWFFFKDTFAVWQQGLSLSLFIVQMIHIKQGYDNGWIIKLINGLY